MNSTGNTRTERREARENRRLRRGVGVLLLLCVLLAAAVGALVWKTVRDRAAQTAAKEQTALLAEERDRLEAEIAVLTEKNAALTQSVRELEARLAETEQVLQPSAAPEAAPAPTPAPTPEPLNIETLAPGTILDAAALLPDSGAFFAAYPIVEGDAVFQRINGKSYRKNNHIGLADLRYLKLLHYNFDHEIQVGEMIVNAALADDVLSIFRELFAAEYEVQSVFLIDNYWTGDASDTDTASIEVNNTSCFNYRPATGSGNLSNHAYGRAIDINPQQNPYLWRSGGTYKWAHENATPYVDRTCGDPHVIVEGDVCWTIFTKYGFSWGGAWTNPIDYQHFEKRG